ncbi:unnamed protein product [Owenia fusiformis]|uniref:Uncharacterized protein n=1 Tax=Owenia fusiformis TaxID=6347 RepID=A0A8J1U9V9_OWEFU|nr:unnamed protein product [Owenia fusiformis]
MASGVSSEPLVVIIPVDGSTHSEHAFDWYNTYLHKSGNKVVILHVYDAKIPTSQSHLETLNGIIAQDQTHVKVITDKYKKKMKDAKKSGEVNSVKGSPGEVIIKQAKEKNASMIVMSSRGMGSLRRTILGSVSDYVIHHSDVPVMVVPKK